VPKIIPSLLPTEFCCKISIPNRPIFSSVSTNHKSIPESLQRWRGHRKPWLTWFETLIHLVISGVICGGLPWNWIRLGLISIKWGPNGSSNLSTCFGGCFTLAVSSVFSDPYGKTPTWPAYPHHVVVCSQFNIRGGLLLEKGPIFW